ncbi:MAG TPA: CdaR family protein [bacterium]
MKLNKIFEKLAQNLSLKILALLIALVLWSYVVGIRQTATVIKVPVEVTHTPDSMMITSPIPKFVNMKVSGPRSKLYEFSSKNLVYEINVSGMQTGRNIFYFDLEEINFPGNLKPIWISPANITIEIAEVISKPIEVEANIIGNPGKGYAVKSIELKPKKIEITGTLNTLQNVEKIYTKPFDISGETENKLGLLLPLEFLDIKYKNIEAETVFVDIYIGPKIVTRVISDYRVDVINNGINFKIFPEALNIELSGPELVLETFPLKDLKAYINIETMKPGNYNIKPVVELPDQIILEHLNPESISVTILPVKK